MLSIEKLLSAGREPDFIIGPEDDPYMKRWWLTPMEEGRKHAVYLHCILADDDDRALHDHPWDNTSIVLSGALREILPCGESIELRAGAVVTRKAEDAHRLEVVEGPVWTLFCSGPYEREWGFHCPNGWVPWKEFVDPDNIGLPGKGCG